MNTQARKNGALVLAISLFALTASAGSPAAQKPQHQEEETVAVFVTGSLIPQRVKVESIGTKTVSPLRVIERREIDQKGRRTTPGILVHEPSLRVLGR